MMVKFLFFDLREVETLQGFQRKPQQPVKHPGPLMLADRPWENGNMQLYGSVVKPPAGPFQLWYSVIHPPWKMLLAYAESDDGIHWRRPELDIFEHEGHHTNIIFTRDPHGPAVIYDERETRDGWRYKMLCGASPSHAICAFRSPDGIRWEPVRRFPVLPTNPDCPMGLLRTPDGRFAALHRVDGYGRRVFRSESWDFLHWSGEPRMILEPDAGDPPQTQFYGMGAVPYGPYEIGTLWIYRTEAEDMGTSKMRGIQYPELAYARGGFAWHRAAQGVPFIPNGEEGDWDRGNLQCASAPVFLPEEIRFYYAGTSARHQTSWELQPQQAGLGMATIKPDRFVALEAGDEEAELLTVAFRPDGDCLFLNVRTGAEGFVKVELLDREARSLPGHSLQECRPVTGDGMALPVVWNSTGESGLTPGAPVRLRVRARHAAIFSIFCCRPEEAEDYRSFTSPLP
ncbi:MAG: hypothetical protein WHZ52_01430 [Armatimonadota bacterium]